MAKMDNGQVSAVPGLPYASVTLNTEDDRTLKGFIAHKIDFATLWAAFNHRTKVEGTRIDLHPDIESETVRADRLGENEENWLVWTKKHCRTGTRYSNTFCISVIS